MFSGENIGSLGAGAAEHGSRSWKCDAAQLINAQLHFCGGAHQATQSQRCRYSVASTHTKINLEAVKLPIFSEADYLSCTGCHIQVVLTKGGRM